MKADEMSETTSDRFSIAVIGMAGRFPGAKNLDEFWDNLQRGVESITCFTDDEMRQAGLGEEWVKTPGLVKAAGVLADIELFDAEFFGMSPREAQTTDPQHRIFLECAWHALEHAGYDPSRYDGRIGVYAGCALSDYLRCNLFVNPEIMKVTSPMHLLIGNDKDHLNTRVSYKLNLRGPGVNVQTTCSTSLVAAHLACQSLLNYETDIALAGGVSIFLPQQSGYLYQEQGTLSPDGRCRVFDADAKGTVPGNGVGIVVLKRLEEALSDGDSIHAVIRGSAINNDGSSKTGYTAPSIRGQAQVIADALAAAGVSPEQISYVEAHGTGTPIGDPIEIAALTQAFRMSADKKQFCAIGSVKSNVGHTNAAAGVAGLIKTILALKHKLIPPSLNFRRANPLLNLAETPFFVNAQLIPWKTGGLPRRAGVSSFGIGGTNAHVVLEGPPENLGRTSDNGSQILLVTGRNQAALEEASRNLADHLDRHPELALADVAHTLQIGRKHFQRRRAVLCRTHKEASLKLRSTETNYVQRRSEEEPSPVVFLFPGQGAQFIAMGQELYHSQQIFKQTLEECAEILREPLGLNLLDVLYTHQEGQAQAIEKIRSTRVAQPALASIELAIAKMWMEWGVAPDAMIGHSLGEYVAACISGVISMEDMLRVIAVRGRLMNNCEPGGMLAVSLPEEKARQFAVGQVNIAALNTDRACVLSGPLFEIEQLESKLAAAGIACRRLATNRAFHSAMVDPILPEFTREIESVELRAPQVPYVSNVTGDWITVEQARSPEYWAEHLRQPVRFRDGLRTLSRLEHAVMIEAGPGHTLQSFVLQQLPHQSITVAGSLSVVNGGSAQHPVLADAIAKVWTANVDFDWSGYASGKKRNRVTLPLYPFQRHRHWVETVPRSVERQAREPGIQIHHWMPSKPPAQTSLVSEGAWLIFLDEGGIGAGLATALSSQRPVITVGLSNGIAVNDRGSIDLDPRRLAHWQTLRRRLRSLEWSITGVINLWGADPVFEPAGDPPASAVEKTGWSNAFHSFAEFVVSLEGLEAVWFVSINAQPVIQQKLRSWSPVELLAAQEDVLIRRPQVACGYIDLASASPGSLTKNAIVETLLKELGRPPQAKAIAYRGAQRWMELATPTLELPAGREASDHQTTSVTICLGSIPPSARGLAVALGFPAHTATAADDPGQPGDNPKVCELQNRRINLFGHERELWNSMVDLTADRRLEIDSYLDRFCAAELLDFIKLQGISADPGSRRSIASLEANLGIPRKYHILLKTMLSLLRRHNLLEIEADHVHFTKVDEVSAAEIRAEAIHRYPGLTRALRLVSHCIANYRRVFEGKIDALSVLFDSRLESEVEASPDGARLTALGVYVHLLKETMTTAIARRNRPVKILEIGAGMGSLTRELIPSLKGLPVEYYFTDIGRSFLIEAERTSAKYGVEFMKFSQLDIMKDPTAQGFQQGSFDFVVGLNVVHATPDVGQAVANLKSLLAQGGLLCLVETVRGGASLDLTWGLTDGWWAFKDEFRTTSPLLGAESWRTVLQNGGFNHVEIYPEDPEIQAASDAALIVAHQFAEEEDGLAKLTTALKNIRREANRKLIVLDYRLWPVGDTIDGHSEDLDWKIGSLAREIGETENVTCLIAFPSASKSEGWARRLRRHSVRAAIRELQQISPAFFALLEIPPDYEFNKPVSGDLAPLILKAAWAGLADPVISLNLQNAVSAPVATTQTVAVMRNGAGSITGLHDRPEMKTSYEAPRDSLEESIASIWQELFGIDQIGRNDNFFDLGGDSLLGMQIISKLRQTFEVDLSVRSLFESPTIATLAVQLLEEQLMEAEDPAIAELLSQLRQEGTGS